MNCRWLINNLGYECRPVPALHAGVTALEVDTPFSFSDGEAIGFYLVETGATVRISDNGDTLSHLSGMGLSHNGNRYKSIRERVKTHGLELSAGGELFALSPSAGAERLIANYITALLSIAAYEREALTMPESADDFVSTVESALRIWKPSESLIAGPRIKGLSHHEYRFDLLYGHRLIEALAPRPASTGAILRKAGDVLNGPFAENYSVLAIIDDRYEPERAETEMEIIASMTEAMLYSRIPLVAPQSLLH